MSNQGDDHGYDDDGRSGGGGGVPGWIWFVLIFGVGNLILYSTTGIFLIPIPRK